jgi:hypothetical protein
MIKSLYIILSFLNNKLEVIFRRNKYFPKRFLKIEFDRNIKCIKNQHK